MGYHIRLREEYQGLVNQFFDKLNPLSERLRKLSDKARTQDYKSLVEKKMEIFTEFRAKFTQLLAKGDRDGAKSLVESLFPEENFHEPDQNMMIGILVQNYPEDYWEAIDANDDLWVLKLLNDDEKAIKSAIERSRTEYGQVHGLYNETKRGLFHENKSKSWCTQQAKKG